MALARTTNPTPAPQDRRETSQLDALVLLMLRIRPDSDEHLEKRIAAIAEQHPQYRYAGATIRTRRARLVDVGYVVDSGDRARTAFGRPATIWKAAA